MKSKTLSSKARRRITAARSRRLSVRLINLVVALLALVFILMGIAMLMDWLLVFRSTILRFAVSILTVAASLFVGFEIWKRLKLRDGIRSTANWLDEVNPALEERLSTVVELEGRSSHSPEMLKAVGNQVDGIGIRSGTRQAILTKPFLAALLAGVFAISLLGVVKFVSGPVFSNLIGRLFQPFSEQTLTELPNDAEDEVHVRGRSFEVAVPVAGKIPGEAVLEYRTSDGASEERRVEIGAGAEVIEATLGRMKEDFDYRVLAGDDETPWMKVRVVDQPQFENFELVVTPPDYTKLAEKKWTLMPSRIEVPDGSELSLRFSVDQDLSSAMVVREEKAVDLAIDESGNYHFQSELAKSGDFEIDLTSTLEDLQSKFPMKIVVTPDELPVVELLEDTEVLAMSSDDVLEVKFQAIDDYGIESAELVAEVTQEDGTVEEFRFPIDLESQAGEKEVKGEASLDLKELPLKEGSELKYSVEVKDERGESSAEAGAEGEEIEKRKLDLAKGEKKGKSESAEVTIDEFANYLIAGDGAKKEQIAIQEVLDMILACAQSGRKVIAEIGDPKDRGDYQKLVKESSPQLIEDLEKGVKAAEELSERSAGTPYSFFGIQAKAMIETGFNPALEKVAGALKLGKPDEAFKNLQLADERLRWVISLLEKNQEKFEKMIEYEEVLQLAHQFKKMHQITIEDMPPSACDCRSGPYPKLKQEFGDEAVQAMIAKLKLKREALKRLSELLQKNPELRARYLAGKKNSGGIYREELSRLRNRQLVLAKGARLLAPDANAEWVANTPKPWNDLLVARLLKFSEQTTEALGIARLWIPTDAPAKRRAEFEDALGVLSQAVAFLASADPLEEGGFDKAVTAVRGAGSELVEILGQAWWKERHEEFGQFRMEDLEGMSDELEVCAELAKSLRAKKGHLFLGQLQSELNGETRAVTLEMMESLSSISGFSRRGDLAINDLEKLLIDRLYPRQEEASGLLGKRSFKEAITAMNDASLSLQVATRLLDTAIVEFIRVQSEGQAAAGNSGAKGRGGAEPLPDPSEEAIEAALAGMLKALEEEARGEDALKLGIQTEKNVQVTTDWEKPQSEKEGLERQKQEQLKAAKEAMNAAAKAQQVANQQAEELAKEMSGKALVSWREQELAAFMGRNEWNTIPSQLRKSLTQDFDTAVPEEFREAIDEYFRIISQINKE